MGIKEFTRFDSSKYDFAFIMDEKLCCNDSSSTRTAKYTGIDLKKSPKTVSAKVIWEKGSMGGTVALIANPNGLKTVDNITAKSLHITFTDKKAEIGLFDGAVNTIQYSYTYPVPIIMDGQTEYEIRWALALDNTKIYLTCPNGELKTHNINGTYDVTQYIGQYITWEHYYEGLGFSRPMLTHIEAKDTDDFIFTDDFERENGEIGNNPWGYPYVQLTNTVTL